jgi:hypothetical protein
MRHRAANEDPPIIALQDLHRGIRATSALPAEGHGFFPPPVLFHPSQVSRSRYRYLVIFKT